MAAANKLHQEHSIDENLHEASWPTRQEAANDGETARKVVSLHEKPETLDVLARRLGEPQEIFVTVAFAGYDPAAGLDQGRQVATERILKAVPTFVQNTLAAWEALGPALRAKVLGFAPELLPVLIKETVALDALNARYDRYAKLASVSRTTCQTRLDEALTEGRELRDHVLRVLVKFVTPSQQKVLGLQAAAEGSETGPRIALGVETLATWITEWLGAMPRPQAEVLAQMGFTDALVADLHACAGRIRETQADLDALTDENRVTQRELDVQDGRTLHVVGMIYQTFRAAARRDKHVHVPALGELDTVFERAPRRASPDEAPKPEAPKPDAPKPA